MLPRTRALAKSWLWVAGAGLLAGIGLSVLLWLGSRPSPEDAYVTNAKDMEAIAGILVAPVAVLATVGWALPIAVGGAALLRRRAYGWWVLIIHTGIGVVVWATGVVVSLILLAHGGRWGVLIGSVAVSACLAMAVFSGQAVRSLLRDPPWEWVPTAGLP